MPDRNPEAAGDAIVIAGLELSLHIGHGPEERRIPQRVTMNLVLRPLQSFAHVGENLGRTVDYAQVVDVVKALALAKPRLLLETLAEEVAIAVLRDFAVAAIDVELRKYILPDVAFVAVQLRRER